MLLTMNPMTRTSVATLLTLVLGCGDDTGDGDDTSAPTDMAAPRPDLGGPQDMAAFVDMTGGDLPEPSADFVWVRVAHLIPDGPPIRLCVGPPGVPTDTDPLPSVTTAPNGIPFRAVLPYGQLPLARAELEVRVFTAEAIGSGRCTLTDEPLFTFAVSAGELTPGAHYTVAALGFITPANYTCLDGALPAPCGGERQATHAIFRDSEANDTSAQIRVVHGIGNAPAVDVCYDADGSAADAEDPSILFSNVPFGTATDYFESPMALTGGSFRIFATSAGRDCAGVELGELAIPTNPELVATFGSTVPNLVTDSYSVGSVHTIMAHGVAAIQGTPSPNPPSDTAVFLPLVDLPQAP